MNKRKLIAVAVFFVIIMIAIPPCCYAQEYSPVQWSYGVKKVGPQEYEVHITGTLQPNWHTYSQHTPAGGPLATKITFARNPVITFSGPVKEVGDLQETYDQNFNVNVEYFNDKIELIQKVVLKSPVKVVVAGELEYMACDDHQCLPPKDVKFSVPIGSQGVGL